MTEGGAVEGQEESSCCSVAYEPFLSCFGGTDVSGLTERNHMSVNVINSNQHKHTHTHTAQDLSPEKISDLKLNINSSPTC